MKQLRKTICLLLALALLCGLAACGREEPASEEPEDTADPVLPVEQEDTVSLTTYEETASMVLPYLTWDTMDPYLCASDVNRLFMPLIFEGLYTIQADGSAEPNLCGELTVRSGRMYQLTVREGAVFSDGTPVTLDDLIWSFGKAMGSGSYYASRLRHIVACYGGDDCLILETNTEVPNFESLLTFPITPRDNPYVGTGWYQKHTDPTTGQVLLTPNPYHEGSDGLSATAIELKGYTDAQQLSDAFSQGDLALMPTDLLSSDSPGYIGDCDIWTMPSNTMVYLGFNPKAPIFSLVYCRYIVGRAIDREGIAQDIYGGYAVPSCLAVPPDSVYYSSDAAEFGDYAPEIIPEYLDQRGFRDYENDGLINAETYYGWFNFSFTILVNAESQPKVQAAQRIADVLAEYSIRATVKAVPWDEYLGLLSARDFDAYIGEVTLSPNYDLYPLAGSGGALNYGDYVSANLDTTLKLGEMDDEYWKQFLTGAVFTPIVFRQDTVLVQRGVLMGLQPNYYNFFANIPDVKVYTAEN